MKTHKVKWLIERSEQNVSLSSLYLSANLIEFDEFVRFIEEHFLEKLHVRGRFSPGHLSIFERQLPFRTDFDLIISKIVKHDALK